MLTLVSSYVSYSGSQLAPDIPSLPPKQWDHRQLPHPPGFPVSAENLKASLQLVW